MEQYLNLVIFLLVGSGFAAIGFFVSNLLSKKNPYPAKLTTYESGEEVVKDARTPFNPRFYIIGIIFLLFEVELLFLFPWAEVFSDKKYLEASSNWMLVGLIEVSIFVIILGLGLAWVWKKGYLDWVIPQKANQSDYKSVVPKALYDDINRKYS